MSKPPILRRVFAIPSQLRNQLDRLMTFLSPVMLSRMTAITELETRLELGVTTTLPVDELLRCELRPAPSHLNQTKRYHINDLPP